MEIKTGQEASDAEPAKVANTESYPRLERTTSLYGYLQIRYDSGQIQFVVTETPKDAAYRTFEEVMHINVGQPLDKGYIKLCAVTAKEQSVSDNTQATARLLRRTLAIEVKLSQLKADIDCLYKTASRFDWLMGYSIVLSTANFLMFLLLLYLTTRTIK